MQLKIPSTQTLSHLTKLFRKNGQETGLEF